MQDTHFLSLFLSEHAYWRQTQRNISAIQTQMVVLYGRLVYAGDAMHYFFGQREVRQYWQAFGECHDELDGVVVVMSHDGVVVTAYRNKKALRAIKRRGGSLCCASVI